MGDPPAGQPARPTARWRQEREASPHGATRLTNCADREISRALLSESVALLHSAQCVEPQIDASEIFNKRTVILARMPRTQPCQQLTVDLHPRRRRRRTTSLGAAGHLRDATPAPPGKTRPLGVRSGGTTNRGRRDRLAPIAVVGGGASTLLLSRSAGLITRT